MLFFEPHALYYFFLKTVVVAKDLLFIIQLLKRRARKHTHTHTMSAKLMDATPDLKRLAPVENLAIDVISYAHGSVTPTLTHLYSKGKDSFLKVRRRYFVVNGETHKNAQRGAFLFSFFLSLLFLSNTRKIRATRAREFTSVGSIVLNATIFARVSTVSLIKAFLRGAWNLDLLISFFFVGATKEPHKFFLLLLR